MILQIPIKVDSRLGMNKQYSGKHWAKRKAEADEVHTAVKIALIKYKNFQLFKNPVKINFKFNSRLDLDNHGYLIKLLIDGLKGYVIEDDNPKYIKQITMEYQSVSNDIIMGIEEV